LINQLRLAKRRWFGTSKMKRLIGLFVAWLVAGLLSGSAVAGPEIARIAIKDGVVELSVQLDRPFDWQGIKFVSIKSFANNPPWFPPTHHELTFGKNGVCEWFQWDYIELGKYKVKGDFTVETTVGSRKIVGKFDPKTNLLKFNGLDYVPMMKSPTVTVKASSDLKSWRKVSRLEGVAKDSEWGKPLAVRFKLTASARQFFIVQIHED
jgi:hypothetical protein